MIPALLVPSTSIQPVDTYRPSTSTAFGRLLLSKFQQNTSTTNGQLLASPAAQQLHSIPPRTTSTTALIVDHLLWLHAQARVASARAVIERDASTGRAQAARASGLHKVIHTLVNKPSSPSNNSDKFRLAFGAFVEQIYSPPAGAVKSKARGLKVKGKKRAVIPEEICALSSATYNGLSASSQKNLGLGPSWAQPLGIVGASNHTTSSSSSFEAGCQSQDRCLRHFASGCTLCAPSSSASTIGAGLDSLPTSAPLYTLRRRLEDLGNVEGKGDRADEETSPTLEALVYFLRLSAYILLSLDDDDEPSMDMTGDAQWTSASASASTDSFASTLESGTPHGSSTDVSVDDADMDSDGDEKRYPPRPVDVQQRLRQSFGFKFSFAREKDDTTLVPSQPLSQATRKSKPTHEWYTLLADLVTRCVLEGYLLCQWKGTEHARVLFGLGSQVSVPDTKRRSIFSRRSTKAESVAKVEPEHQEEEDGLPSLNQTAQLFFGAGADPSALGAYRQLMDRRLEEFMTVSSTTSLVGHLELLARKYGFMATLHTTDKCADRSVVEFCEAVVQWKGVPELEQYKQAQTASASSLAAPVSPVTPTTTTNGNGNRSSPRMSIAALIHHTSPPTVTQTQLDPLARFFTSTNLNDMTRRSAPRSHPAERTLSPITPSLSPTTVMRDIPIVHHHHTSASSLDGIHVVREDMNAYGGAASFGVGPKTLDNTFVLGSKRPREDEEGDGECLGAPLGVQVHERPLKKLLVAGSGGKFSS